MQRACAPRPHHGGTAVVVTAQRPPLSDGALSQWRGGAAMSDGRGGGAGRAKPRPPPPSLGALSSRRRLHFLRSRGPSTSGSPQPSAGGETP